MRWNIEEGIFRVIIPHDQVAEETLMNLIEAFIHREGTDYGEREVTRAQKIRQVHQQLVSGRAVILYDAENADFTIIFKDQLDGGVMGNV